MRTLGYNVSRSFALSTIAPQALRPLLCHEPLQHEPFHHSRACAIKFIRLGRQVGASASGQSSLCAFGLCTPLAPKILVHRSSLEPLSFAWVASPNVTASSPSFVVRRNRSNGSTMGPFPLFSISKPSSFCIMPLGVDARDRAEKWTECTIKGRLDLLFP